MRRLGFGSQAFIFFNNDGFDDNRALAFNSGVSGLDRSETSVLLFSNLAANAFSAEDGGFAMAAMVKIDFKEKKKKNVNDLRLNSM